MTGRGSFGLPDISLKKEGVPGDFEGFKVVEFLSKVKSNF